jgi:peptidoglycan/LPS O-acetylase OafA/YrhL
LAHELIFYLLAGTCFFLVGPRQTDLLAALWLTVSLSCRLIGMASVPYHFKLLSGITYAPLFVIGLTLYRIRSGQSGYQTLGVLVFAFMMCWFRPAWTMRPISHLSYAALIFGFAALVWIGTMTRSPLGYVFPLVFLGEISYPLYLIHQNVGYVLIERFSRLGLSPNRCVIVVLLTMILVALSISRLAEKPGQKFTKWLFERCRIRVGRTPVAPTLDRPPYPGAESGRRGELGHPHRVEPGIANASESESPR